MQRITDLVITLFLLPSALVFLLVLSVLIILIDHFSPFYPSKRIGKDGNVFTCFKLQTLNPADHKDTIVNAQKNQARLTHLGLIIRNHGWDELPQLFNILIGEMSFIGPRPLVIEDYQKLLKNYPEKRSIIEGWWSCRQRVLPGLSGWHQIHLPDHHVIEYDMGALNGLSFRAKVYIFITSIGIFIVGKKLFFKEAIPLTYEIEV